MKVIVAFDSFKGSANSLDLARAAKDAIIREIPDCEVIYFPLADGGEGTTEAVCYGLSAEVVHCHVHDPLNKPLEASYAIAKGGLAIMEMAAASGLPLIPQEYRNPLYTTSIGTGEMIIDAISRGCRHFILGLGGSATNDAGMGLLHALGVRFLDNKRQLLEPIGLNLGKVMDIDESSILSELKDCSFTLACDVSNLFFGPQGAACIFAPQKGANDDEVIFLDTSLRHYANLLKTIKGVDVSQIPGAGAAGGMGGGLLPFLSASLCSGVDIILETLHFKDALEDADLVLTGEGKLDHQTVMGKALGGILHMSYVAGVPVIALGGCVEQIELLNQYGFTAVFSIQSSPVSLEQAMQTSYTLERVKQTVVQIMRVIQNFKIKG